MPDLLERPAETDATANPFADLIPSSGQDGGPAYQVVGGRFSEVPKAEVAAPAEVGNHALYQPTSFEVTGLEGNDPNIGAQLAQIRSSPGEYGDFADLVPPSPAPETEKAVAETPAPPKSDLIDLEKGISNVTGQPFHEVLNTVRVFGTSAGKYIYRGLQGLRQEQAKLLANPTPEMVASQPEAVLLPKDQQDALEQQYTAETQAGVPDAVKAAEYWKHRAATADSESAVDPALEHTIPARLAAAAGEATAMGMESLVPGVGLPLMTLHGALATEAEAKNNGATDEAAEMAGVRSAIGLAIFGGASKVAALGVAKLLPSVVSDPSKLTNFIAQFAGQEGANEASSRAISAWNAAADAPPGQKVDAAMKAATAGNLESSTLNAVYALMHASRAAGEAPVRPASEPGAEPTVRHWPAPDAQPEPVVVQGAEPVASAPEITGEAGARPEPAPAVEPSTAAPEVNDWTQATAPEPAPAEPVQGGGEPNAIPEPSADAQIPRAAETGQDQPEGGSGVRPSEQGVETAKPGQEEPAPQEPVAEHGAKLKLKANKEGGFVNADLLQEAADFGKRLYTKGMDFARWSGEMIRHLGEKVKEHLTKIWDAVKSQGDERGGIGGLAGKGFGLKISGKRNDLNAATAIHGSKRQRATAESDRMQKEINKAVPSARRQAAITVNIEADGDPALLAHWEGLAKGKAFKRAAQDAQTLTPAETAIRDKAAQTFEILGKRGQQHDVIGAQLRDNYAPHVWDVSKSGSGIGSSKLVDKFKFAKARTFGTLFDGDQANFVPKTMAIGDLLPAYSHELNKVIADKQFGLQAAGGMSSEGTPLLIPRGNAKVVDASDYAVRNADGSPLPKFQKAIYDTQAEAQAALQPGQTIEKRDRSATIVNPRGFAKAVDANGDPIDQSQYKTTDHPALSNFRWLATDPKGNTVIMKGDLAAHPELLKRLNAMTGQSEIRRWYNEPTSGSAAIPRAIVKGLDTAQSVMKREMFGLLAPFHQVQEGTHAVGHTVNPFGGLEDMSKPTAAHIDSMEHGLQLHSDSTSASHYMEGVGGKNSFLSQAARKFGGPAGRAIANTIDGYQNYLFKQYIPALKFKTYEHILERNMGRYVKELKSGEVTEGDVKMLSAEQTNAAYGHLNYALLDRNPTIQHLLQLSALAPDFLEARGRFTVQALRSLAGSKAGHEQFRAIATLALVQAGAAYTISKLLGDDWDAKHPFEVTHNGRTYTLRSVPEDLFRLIASGPDVRREFVSARMNPVLQKLDQLRTGKNYRGEQTSAMETIGELLANYIPITARSIPGVRQLTETGRNQNISPLEQLAGSLGVKVSRYSPITKTYQLASQWKDANGIAADTGVYPISKYQQLRYALEDGDFDRARSEYDKLIEAGEKKNKISDGFHESVNHPFTGSTATDRKFKASLADEDRAMYDLAVQKRHAILQRFQAMRAGSGGTLNFP